MRELFSKVRLKLLYRIAKFFEVKPFLEADPNEYCPACGAREGKIQAVGLQSADPGGSKVALLHECAACKYKWLAESVTIIKNHLMEEPALDEEQEAIKIMTADKRTKSIRVSGKKVNGELVS